jgi:serine-type D-Ala-D-Ala carboxypeptidase/endopeptidase (penicillin-binding protein 4)
MERPTPQWYRGQVNYGRPMRRETSAILPLFVTLACVLSSERTVTAGSATEEAELRLRNELKTILSAPELQSAFSGVHVRSLRTGRTLFEHNASKLFNPASNMKLLTTAAALRSLGPTYRFRTQARVNGKIRSGNLVGNLYIQGRGDPTLTTEALFGFVNEIALSGLKTVSGDLVIDDTFFDGVSEGPGWEQENSDQAYAAPVGAFAVNFGTFTLRLLPGEAPGSPARVVTWPEVPSLSIESHVTTRGPRSRPRLFVGTSRDPHDGVQVTLRGSISTSETGGIMVRRRVFAPGRYAGEMLRAMLEVRGVSVKGSILMGSTPKEADTLIATHWSAPLSELVGTLNKYSNNFMAEQILKTMGAELYKTPGSWEKGNAAIRDFLTSLGTPDGTFVLGNGSGLNDVNRVTPQQVTKVLEAMYQRFETQPEFVSSLAVAGNSGTIGGRFENSPAVSRLRAKTGTLTGVSALSGYVATQDDEILVFSVMMNDYPGRARSMWGVQDRIGIALARFGTSEMAAKP